MSDKDLGMVWMYISLDLLLLSLPCVVWGAGTGMSRAGLDPDPGMLTAGVWSFVGTGPL